MLRCEMRHECDAPVTHIDQSGWIYCTAHGIQRRCAGLPCRKLRGASCAPRSVLLRNATLDNRGTMKTYRLESK